MAVSTKAQQSDSWGFYVAEFVSQKVLFLYTHTHTYTRQDLTNHKLKTPDMDQTVKYTCFLGDS